jgi:hypothetical protein
MLALAPFLPERKPARLQAFLDDLAFEWFGVRVSLAHGDPGDKIDRVRLKMREHHRP